MKLSTQNKTTKNKGIIKSKPLVDILVEKTEKKLHHRKSLTSR